MSFFADSDYVLKDNDDDNNEMNSKMRGKKNAENLLRNVKKKKEVSSKNRKRVNEFRRM